jgi:hypothetical protein
MLRQLFNLLYVPTSFLWRQAVVGTTVVKSSNALRMNARCTWRHMEGLRNVHNTTLNSTRSPSRLCGSIKVGVYGCPRWVAPIKYHPESRANEGGEHRRSHDTIAAQFLVMRGPHGCPIFAPALWPRHTGYSSEALDMTVHKRNRERGIQ